jgi:TonB family protein
MSKLALKSLFFVAALLVSVCSKAAEYAQQSVAPVIVEPSMITTECEVPVYPRSALKDEKSGVVFLGFLVSATGGLERAEIINTSGVNALDQGALIPMSKCQFKPGTIDGKPVAMWMGRHYHWEIENDRGSLIRVLTASAKTGNIPALYSLYYLYTIPPAADATVAEKILNLAAAGGEFIGAISVGTAVFGQGGRFCGRPAEGAVLAGQGRRAGTCAGEAGPRSFGAASPKIDRASRAGDDESFVAGIR